MDSARSAPGGVGCWHCPPDAANNPDHISGQGARFMVRWRRHTSTLASALIALAWLTVAAPAQDFPARTVRIVVAFPAGGPTDFVARLLADKLKSLLGQSVVVE